MCTKCLRTVLVIAIVVMSFALATDAGEDGRGVREPRSATTARKPKWRLRDPRPRNCTREPDWTPCRRPEEEDDGERGENGFRRTCSYMVCKSGHCVAAAFEGLEIPIPTWAATDAGRGAEGDAIPEPGRATVSIVAACISFAVVFVMTLSAMIVVIFSVVAVNGSEEASET